jgi:exopolysaccharide biosynthesis polyprenyl glycosylphosphotransferase
MGEQFGINSLRLKTVFPARKLGAKLPDESAGGIGSAVAGSTWAGSLESKERTAKRAPHGYVYGAIFGDWLVVVLASAVAFWLRFHTSLRDVGVFDTRTVEQYLKYFAFGSVTLIIMLGWLGLYQRSALLRRRWNAGRIAQGVVIWTLGFLAVTVVFKMQPPISRLFMALNGACAFVMLLVWRRGYDAFLRSPRRLAGLKQRTVFVGWNDDASQMLKTLRKDADTGFDVIGWVRTGDAEETAPGQGVTELGSLEEMDALLAQHHVDMVVAAQLNGSREQIVSLANLCERELVQFKVIPSCFRIFVSGLHLETVAGTPILGVDRLPLDNSLNVLLKRLVDIVGGVIGLVLFAPVIAAFAAAVYFESPGSVFYRQRRTGLNGRPFDIIKIRSMRVDAEKGTGATWCQKNDPRRLRVGAFMRKWNIDELPQFWNVLKGEMSLVGPRPERPELIRNFKHQVPHYQARHNAKPGMTGWAQVQGWRGDTDLGERIKCDLWYLENWNVMLDMEIMLLTFFKRDNAY